MMPPEFPDLLTRTRRIICEELLAAGTGLQDSTDLFESGLDSMAIMQLLLMLEEEFGTTIPVEEVTREHFRTVRTVAALVAAKLGSEVGAVVHETQVTTGIPKAAAAAPDAPMQPFQSLELKNCDYFVLSFDAMMRAKGEGGHVAHSLVELEAVPDVAALRRGMDLAAARYPLLSARLRRRWGVGLPHWVPGREILMPELVLRVEKGAAGKLPGARACENADQEVEALINTRLPCRDDARWVKMRVAIVERRDGSATLVLSWSHFVVDGKGAELFLQALHDLGAQGGTPVMALDPPRPADSRRLGEIWAAAAPITSRFDEITKHRFDSLAPRKSGGGPIRYEVRVLDDRRTAAVKARCRSFSELVNLPFQLACAMRAHQAVFESRGTMPDSLLCSVPVQTRRAGAQGPIFQNHLRMFFGQCLREELRTLEDAVAGVTAQHQRYLRDGLDKAFDEWMNLMRPMPPGLYMKIVQWRMKGLFNSFFHSDTGEFAAGLVEFLGAPVRTAYHIPGFTSPPGTGLFVNEKHGRLVLAACWRGDVITARERAVLWERWLDDLGAPPERDKA